MWFGAFWYKNNMILLNSLTPDDYLNLLQNSIKVAYTYNCWISKIVLQDTFFAATCFIAFQVNGVVHKLLYYGLCNLQIYPIWISISILKYSISERVYENMFINEKNCYL